MRLIAIMAIGIGAIWVIVPLVIMADPAYGEQSGAWGKTLILGVIVMAWGVGYLRGRRNDG